MTHFPEHPLLHGDENLFESVLCDCGCGQLFQEIDGIYDEENNKRFYSEDCHVDWITAQQSIIEDTHYTVER